MRVVTIADVADAAKVSVATVSRTLNNNTRVDPALAERVRAAVEQLGYRPSSVARNLRRRGTHVWALVIPDINNPFYTAVARGVEDVASESGFSVLLCNSDEDQQKQDRYLEVAAHERVAGVILAPCAQDSDVAGLRSGDIPLVAVDRPLSQQVDFVTAASFEGAVIATEHLLRQGWRRPACITRPADTGTTEQRRLGYANVVARYGLPEISRHVPFHADSGGAGVIIRLFDSDDPPDSLLAADSMLALGVLTALQRRNLKLGRDVGLVSFDDAAWMTVVEPPISVVVQPAYQIGAEAARLLVRRIRDEGPNEPQTLIMSTTLIVRGSCSRAVRSRPRSNTGSKPARADYPAP